MPHPPAFSTWDPVHNKTMSFTEMTSALGAGLGIIPLLAVIENVAIAKAFGERLGDGEGLLMFSFSFLVGCIVRIMKVR